MPLVRPYPVFLDLRGRHVMVVGGGAVALRKTRGLLHAGARITLVAPAFVTELARFRRVRRIRRRYLTSHMKARPWRLVFAATDSPSVNAHVRRDASAAGILCCRCDDSGNSDFAGAATAQAGGITLAISTGHASPALSARIRDQAAAAVDSTLVCLAGLLPPWRARLKRLIANPQLRRDLLQRLSGETMENVLRRHGPGHARALFARWLAETRRLAGNFGAPAKRSDDPLPLQQGLARMLIDDLQILSALLIAAMYAAAYVLGHRHMRGLLADPSGPSVHLSMGLRARVLVGFATLLIAALLAWRAASQGNDTLPFTHHLDAFLVLSFLLAIALIYFRWTRHLAGLSFYIVPMIVIVLLLGVILQILRPGPFHPWAQVWNMIHLAAIITGSVCFALACVGGIVYLAAARRLKTKNMGPAQASRFPPLASLEKFDRWMVYIGFPLLTIGIVTGVLSIWHGGAHQPLPKMAMALAAWIIYAAMLPLAPRFRGARAAWLSIVGFFFILGGYVAATWIK